MVDKNIKGDLSWIKASEDRYDEFEGKKSWSAQIHPDKDSLELVREMQADGIKNKLKRDEKGWYVKFSHPLVKTDKAGKITQVYTPPMVINRAGEVITGSVNNGATGEVVVNFYEHPLKGGAKSYAARLKKIILDDYSLYGDQTKVSTEVKQENYF
jgi:hypothetical protein